MVTWALPRPRSVLLPEGAVPSFAVLALVYVIAIVLGIASHAPGGSRRFYEATIVAGPLASVETRCNCGPCWPVASFTRFFPVVATAGILIWEVMRRRQAVLDKQARFAKRLVEPLVLGLSAKASSFSVAHHPAYLRRQQPGYAPSCEVASDIVPEFL
ncbi:hypothetical protein VXQ18_06675 [Brucella abortus]|nr:hypothetical protein [Brucella abortus]